MNRTPDIATGRAIRSWNLFPLTLFPRPFFLATCGHVGGRGPRYDEMTMCRLFVIPARDVPVALILRRGPSQWSHVVRWNTTDDTFDHGAWIKGRIYEEKCDISPDGRFFVYFIHQGSRFGTRFTHAWTAVSRV